MVYDNLTGNVTSLIQDDENFYVVFQFDQIGEEVIQFNENEWNEFLVGEQVTFSVDSSGQPLHLTSKSDE
ncbi:hypothetical protein ACFSTH_07085 [Paenibacillus yanchengensis]|uniref:Uncharacterized protein n=1 Tax=Paenibacillus yanchengensis TaxID=2035833 RepID=A0ABW4YI03_9BACL